MERVKMILVGLPLFLLLSDLINLFTPPPPKPPHHDHGHGNHHGHDHHHPPPVPTATQPFPEGDAVVGGGIGLGNTVKIDFCSSCSYRGNGLAMKKMLELQFPGIDVVLENYPAPLPKRLLSKAVPAVQVGVLAVVVAGEQIFPMIGLMAPPPWYYSLRANKFGTIASTWLLGNTLQSFLQSSGAFEVYCNGDLVFSKLKEGRFPGEIELQDLVQKRVMATRTVPMLS